MKSGYQILSMILSPSTNLYIQWELPEVFTKGDLPIGVAPRSSRINEAESGVSLIRLNF